MPPPFDGEWSGGVRVCLCNHFTLEKSLFKEVYTSALVMERVFKSRTLLALGGWISNFFINLKKNFLPFLTFSQRGTVDLLLINQIFAAKKNYEKRIESSITKRLGSRWLEPAIFFLHSIEKVFFIYIKLIRIYKAFWHKSNGLLPFTLYK